MTPPVGPMDAGAGQNRRSGAAISALGVLAIVVAAGALVWLSWSTMVAFQGGHIPLTGIHLDSANHLRGFAWLLVGDPIALSVIAAGVSVAMVSRAAAAPDPMPLPVRPGFGLRATRQTRVHASAVLRMGMSSAVQGSYRILVVAAFSLVFVLGGFVWLVWSTVVAFIGGRIPLTPWHWGGISIERGVFWFAFVAPITVYVVFILYAVMVTAAAAGPMRASLEAAQAHGVNVTPMRNYLHWVCLIALAAALAAGVIWQLTT